MNEMTLDELFEVGISFESSIGEGTKSERARIPKNYSRLSLTEEMISTLVGFDKEINFLVAGEIWCPDFQLNTTVLKKFTELNSNFNISVITMGRGKKYLSTILDRDKDTLKFPLILALDKDLSSTFILLISSLLIPIPLSSIVIINLQTSFLTIVLTSNSINPSPFFIAESFISSPGYIIGIGLSISS